MKRRYKLLIYVLTIWAFGIFPIWILIPDPHLASRNVEGAIAGLLFIVLIVGGLIWAIWPKNSN